MDASPSQLYPVVQDLTDAEYGICCCPDVNMLGTTSYSLEQLAVPVLEPRKLSKDFNNGGSTSTSSSSTTTPIKKGHMRWKTSPGSSLLNRLEGSMFHRRCVSDVSVDSSGTLGTEVELTLEKEVKFDDIYVLTRQVFRCNSSTIWECINREHGSRFCVKVIDRRRFSDTQEEEAATVEKEIHQTLSGECENIVSLLEVWDESPLTYLVMEYVEGGNLLSTVNRKPLSEEQAQDLARCVLRGVAHLHSQQICHNDIQPGNILLASPAADEYLLAKICDFGCAQLLGGSDAPPKFGTIAYAAPEVLKAQPHDTQSDMWSVGVLLYYAMCGRVPFEETKKRVLLKRVTKADFEFHPPEWDDVSRRAKQFISSLLFADPSIRMTAEEALDHPWLYSAETSSKNNTANPNGPMRRQSSILKRLFKRNNSLEKSPISASSIPQESPIRMSLS